MGARGTEGEAVNLRRELFMAALAIVSVAIGLYQVSRPDLEARFTWLDAVDLGIVLLFAADLAWRARRSGVAGRYLRRHWWELPSLVPSSVGLLLDVGGIPLLRGLRLLRVVRVLRLLRIAGVLLRFRTTAWYLLRIARRAQVLSILGVGAVIVALGALLMYAVESPYNERVATLGEAAWWTFNMVTNVAYVDFQPVTLGGRILAGLLQLCGIGFIGILAATLTNALLKEPEPERPDAP